MYKNIMSNSLINASAGMLLLATGFCCSVIIARVLGPEANGTIAFMLWVSVTGSMIAELGTSILLMRLLPQLKARGFNEGQRRGFAAYLAYPVLAATVLLGLGFAAFFLQPETLKWVNTTEGVVILAAFLLFTQSMSSFTKNYLIGEQSLGTFFRLTAIASVLQLSIVLFGSLFWGIDGAMIGYIAGQSVGSLYTLRILATRRDKAGYSGRFLVEASTVLFFEFLVSALLLTRPELFFLQHFRTIKEVGFYAVALSLSNMALQLPVQLTGSLIPFYAERRGAAGGAVSGDVFAGVVRSFAYVTFPLCFGLAAISSPLVVTIYGKAFAPAGLVVAILAVGSPAYVFIQLVTQLLYSMDRAKYRLIISVIGGLLMVGGCLVAVPLWGGIGAALIRGLVFLVMGGLMLRHMRLENSPRFLAIVILRIATAAAACGLAALLIAEQLNGLTGIAVGVAAGAIIYALMLRLLAAIPPQDAEIIQVLLARLPSRAARIGTGLLHFIAPHTASDGPTIATHDSVGAQRATLCSSGTPVRSSRSVARPVIFSQTVGLFMPAASEAPASASAVLFLSPWGFEEMCTRKVWRDLAERFADSGIASLRFDYPGTGDSLDDIDFSSGLTVWMDSIESASRELFRLSGCSGLIVIGHGLGGTLAAMAAPRLKNVQAVAMLAPVVNGRLYLRELAAWSRMIDEGLSLRPEHRIHGHISVAGLTMPDEIAAALRTLSIEALPTLPAPRLLMVERPARSKEVELSAHFASLGGDVTRLPYLGYDDLVSNPTIAKYPTETVEQVTAWTIRTAAAGPLFPIPMSLASEQASQTALKGPDFIETPVRFGHGNRLFGILCSPLTERRGATVICLGTANDRQTGWARSTLQTARYLAAHGVASLRFDAANVGDSPPVVGAPEQVLFSDYQIEDVVAAFDFIDARALGPAMLVGRCSGAYLAFRSALRDRRCKAVIAINPFTFIWDKDEKVEDALRHSARSLEDYSRRVLSKETYQNLRAGRIDVRHASINMARQIAHRLILRLPDVLTTLTQSGRLRDATHGLFQVLFDRKVPLSLIYGGTDIGLDRFYYNFGLKGQRLRRYSNVTVEFIRDADHNMSPPAAKAIIRERVLAAALKADETIEMLAAVSSAPMPSDCKSKKRDENSHADADFGILHP